MNQSEICPQEPMVLAAHAGGPRSEALSRHLEFCVSCQEAVKLATVMRQLTEFHTAKQAPDAEVIWMLAQISKPRAVWTSGGIKGAAALAASALLAAWSWSAIAGYVSSLVPPPAMALVPLIVSCIVAAGLAVVALTTNGLLTEE